MSHTERDETAYQEARRITGAMLQVKLLPRMWRIRFHDNGTVLGNNAKIK